MKYGEAFHLCTLYFHSPSARENITYSRTLVKSLAILHFNLGGRVNNYYAATFCIHEIGELKYTTGAAYKVGELYSCWARARANFDVKLFVDLIPEDHSRR